MWCAQSVNRETNIISFLITIYFRIVFNPEEISVLVTREFVKAYHTVLGVYLDTCEIIDWLGEKKTSVWIRSRRSSRSSADSAENY